jgi:hypothetical protein
MHITNITVYNLFLAGNDGQIRYQGALPDADEIVIRQITFASESPARGIYLIQSNINNGIIGVCSAASSIGNPGTTIKPHTPLPNYLTFQLMMPESPPYSATMPPGDFISISMDFIKY